MSGELRVSYAALEGVSRTLTVARNTFAERPIPSANGAFGAEPVESAFARFRAAQERSTGWLVDTSRTLAQFAYDTRQLVPDTDTDLARGPAMAVQ
ncbi:hypothetical protein [Curtobacterium sp. 'Ferrero']|uniref:hypothetical protein n=1 Tax=Curtobacterium sp. 'Ferrero' TaxID=2033654 RepID=UPI001142F7FB|nr:hypothetical protein [Curtobacterium sp. 'Ferrero']